MNSLFGTINLQKTNNPSVIEQERFENDTLSLEISRNHVFNYDADNYFFNSTDNCLMAIMGYFTNIDEIRKQFKIDSVEDLKVMYSLYKLEGHKFLDKLDGVFLILHFDFNNSEFKVFQSKFGMNLPFYYFKENNKLYFGTSLKKLLPHKASRAFNTTAALNFIYYEQVIPNEITLVEGINKLVPRHILEFNMNDGSLNKRKYVSPRQKVTKDKAKQILINTLEDSLRNISQNLTKDIAMTHTGGWDSNIMLYFFRKFTKSNINTATISGGEKIDEVAVVKTIQKTFYDNISHYTATVQPDISCFPHLVWIYEGYVFQEGMFLRYELSKLLHNNGIRTIFLGAAADQMLFPPDALKRFTRNLPENKIITFLKNIKKSFTGKQQASNTISRKSLNRTFKNNDFDNAQVDMLLKMHEIVLNYNDITGLFPYLNKKTSEASIALGKINKEKKYYKQKVRETLGEEIASYLAKSHSVVDTKNIFNVNRDFLIQQFTEHKEFILNFINKETYQKIALHPDDNHLLVMHCIYLVIFNKLFISQQYDDKFSNPKLTLTFQDLN
jgi:asparagine synthetase B (glutamine-hydrolysing)